MHRLLLLALFAACTAGNPADSTDPTDGTEVTAEPPLDEAALEALSMVRVRDDVELLASDDLAGRAPGSPGHRFARDYLAAEMADAGLLPVGDSLILEHPLVLSRNRYAKDEEGGVYAIDLEQTGYNLLGVRPGTDPAKADQMVLLVAHYDHLGVTAGGKAYNGAYDDITAVCALLELARVLDEQGLTFGRTVGFLFTDAEEDGLTGAAAYVSDPAVPLLETAVVISLDPIGRGVLPDYDPLFFIGAERSPEIGAAIAAVQPFASVPLAPLNRSMLLGYASDQDEFWNAPDPVPAVWVASGGNTFYHTVDDDPVTIDYRTVQHHLRALAMLVAELATGEAVPTDLGLQELSVADLESAVVILDGALGSSEITEQERASAEDYRDAFERGIDNADATGSEQRLAYLEMLLFAVQELSVGHVGPIPPPFPE